MNDFLRNLFQKDFQRFLIIMIKIKHKFSKKILNNIDKRTNIHYPERNLCENQIIT